MSHFAVLVVGDNVDEQLRPFWELDLSQEEAAVDDRAVFEDKTDEVYAEFESEEEDDMSRQVVELATGRRYWPWDRELKKRLGIVDEFGHASIEEEDLPKGFKYQDMSYKDIYGDVDTFAEDYHGYQRNAKGRFGYYHNPKAKWDWFSVGGRWSGALRLKPGGKGLLGDTSAFGTRGHKDAEDGNFCDQCRKGDIDLDWMEKERAAKANAYYDKLHSVLNGIELPPSWDEVREEKFKGDVDAAREWWQNHPAMVALKESPDAREFLGLFSTPIEDYAKGRAALVESAINNAFVFFAFLRDGKWYERGNMGWWGIVFDEKDPDAWAKEFKRLFNEVPDDEIVTIVDCHI